MAKKENPTDTQIAAAAWFGYAVHQGAPDDETIDERLRGRWWWTLARPMCDIECGQGDFATEAEAWADAVDAHGAELALRSEPVVESAPVLAGAAAVSYWRARAERAEAVLVDTRTVRDDFALGAMMALLPVRCYPWDKTMPYEAYKIADAMLAARAADATR